MFTEYLKAIEWEKRIKGWSRRKKEALINGDWDKLKEFSKCINETRATTMCTAAPFDSAQGDT
jgi:putative endonuclease